MTTQFDITKIGLLMRTSFSMFKPARMDKAGRAEYAKLHGIDINSVKLTNDLIDGKYLDLLESVKTDFNKLIDARTVPFDRSGHTRSRIVTAALVPDVQDLVAKYKVRWANAVDDFAASWNDIVADARRRLNGNFAKFEHYYPSEERVRDEFRMDITFMPMPDFAQLSLLSSEVSAQMRDLYEDNIRDAGAELRKRLVDKLLHLSTRCGDVGGETRTAFHATNVTHVLDLCDMLPKMLVADDPELLQAIDEARDMLAGLDADSIKSSPLIANDIKSKAAAIAGLLL